MLDVSVRMGILNLMLELKRGLNLTCLFITHDLGVARYFCDRIAVMYHGRIVEVGETEALLNNPLHPYTKLLIDSVPGRGWNEQIEDEGGGDDIATEMAIASSSAAAFVPGCSFNPRCPLAKNLCRVEVPELVERKPDHLAACHFPMLEPLPSSHAGA